MPIQRIAGCARAFGTPARIERPIARNEDVLVHVQAEGASIGDYSIVASKPCLIRLTPFGGDPDPVIRCRALAWPVESRRKERYFMHFHAILPGNRGIFLSG